MFLHKYVNKDYYQMWLETTTDSKYVNEYDMKDLEWKGLNEATKFKVERVTDHSRFLVGTFYLSPMPGCCGVVVSHFTLLDEKSRHSGLSQKFRDVKAEVAKLLGYTVMLGTTDMGNIPALGSFFKIYHIFHTFINKRTNHHVAIGYKVL